MILIGVRRLCRMISMKSSLERDSLIVFIVFLDAHSESPLCIFTLFFPKLYQSLQNTPDRKGKKWDLQDTLEESLHRIEVVFGSKKEFRFLSISMEQWEHDTSVIMRFRVRVLELYSFIRNNLGNNPLSITM